MNVRKLMGRLNAATTRFDTGVGGDAGLTPQEVAGALGMARPQLGVELLCLAYWPDGARLNRNQVAEELLMALLKEYSRRQEERTIAALRHLMRRGRETFTKGWPRIGPGYPALVRAVIMERITPRLCETCEGQEDIAIDTGRRLCPTCEGRGTVRCSDRTRAKRMDIHHKSFVETWLDPYNWLLHHCSDLESEAARQIDRGMGGLEE